MEKNIYCVDDYETDIGWLREYNLADGDIKQFIKYLLNSTPSKKLKSTFIAEKL